VQQIVRSGEPVTGIEISGQRADGSNVDRVWITYWHPLKDRNGSVAGINVAAEEVTVASALTPTAPAWKRGYAASTKPWPSASRRRLRSVIAYGDFPRIFSL
jgi:hypothetical protein